MESNGSSESRACYSPRSYSSGESSESNESVYSYRASPSPAKKVKHPANQQLYDQLEALKEELKIKEEALVLEKQIAGVKTKILNLQRGEN